MISKAILLALIFISCNRHTVYMGNSARDKRYREYIKSVHYDSIPEDKIPSNCGLVLDSYEDLIDRKTHIVIGKQWYDFKDGSEPGIYYIIMPTKWELRRDGNEKKWMLRKYHMKYISPQEYEKMLKDTSSYFIISG